MSSPASLDASALRKRSSVGEDRPSLSESRVQNVSVEAPLVGKFLERIKQSGCVRMTRLVTCQSEVTACKLPHQLFHGTLLTGHEDGSVCVYGHGNTVTATLAAASNLHPVTCLCLSSPSQVATGQGVNVVVSRSSGDLSLLKLDPLSTVAEILEPRRQVFTVDVNHDGTRLVSGGDDAALHLYDLETRQRIHVLTSSINDDVVDGHTSRVFACRYHPTRHQELCSAGWDNTLFFWDERCAHAVRYSHLGREGELGPHVCAADGVDMEPGGGDAVVTASWRNEQQVQVWSYSTGKLVACVQDGAIDTWTYGVRWMRDGKVMAAGSKDNNLHVIDTRDMMKVVGEMKNMPAPLFCLDTGTSLHDKVVAAVGTGRHVVQMTIGR